MSKSIDADASAINKLHRDGINLSLNAIGVWKQVGELLAAKKQKLGHGNYLEWVEANCDFSRRTASNYVNVHENWADIQAQIGGPNGKHVSHLTMRDVLRITRQVQDVTEDTSTEPAEVDVPENPTSVHADAFEESYPEPLQGEVIDEPEDDREPDPPPRQNFPPKRTAAEELDIQRKKTQKTLEALIRAFDDLEELSSWPEQHGKALVTCRKLIETVKAWE